MVRVAINLGSAAGLDDFARVHHDDAVRHLGHDAQVVGDEKETHAGLFLKLLQQREDLRLHGHVERGRGFVSDQDVGLQRQRHRDHQPLPLTARELVRIGVDLGPEVGDADPFHQLERPGPRIGLRHAVRRHHLPDLEADGIDRVQVTERILEDHRDPLAVDLPALLLGHLQDVPALEQDLSRDDLAGRAIDQVHDGAGRHGLAGSAFAQDRQRLAPVEVPGHVSHRVNGALRGLEIDRKAANLEQMACHHFFLGVSSRHRCTGSSAVRIQFDSRFSDRVVRMIAMPGQKDSHQAVVR